MNSFLKKYGGVLLFAVLTVMVICFIFSNSIQDSGTSNAVSGSLSEKIKLIIDPYGNISEEDFHKVVRKMAHGLEFLPLGLCLSGLMYNLCILNKSDVRQYVFTELFIVLAIAVLDEFLQNFTGRTSAVKDVLIDFGGAISGIGLSVLVNRLMSVYSRSGN